VYVGYRTPEIGDRRLYALDVATQVLAGGKGSRLHRRLVREGRIAQDIAMFQLASSGGPSVLVGWATVRPDATIDAVEGGLLEEIGRLRTEEITDDELLRAKALIETDELGSLQRVSERADRLGMYATMLDDPGEINRQLDRYLAVTAADVREACAGLLADDGRVVLTYVPAAPAPEEGALGGEADGGEPGGPLADDETEAGA
jgi:predicted Zn-dependent peptidase